MLGELLNLELYGEPVMNDMHPIVSEVDILWQLCPIMKGIT